MNHGFKTKFQEALQGNLLEISIEPLLDQLESLIKVLSSTDFLKLPQVQ
jgi:hypothetical protein